MKIEIQDQIWKAYNSLTNMTVKQLISFKKDTLSISNLPSRTPINIAIRLKSKPKRDWELRDYRRAMRSISYLRRNRRAKGKEYILMNWGYNPKT